MERPILTELVGDYRYQVFYDLSEDFDIDFDSEEDKEEYIREFERGNMILAYVEKSKKCECCGQFEFMDGVGCMHADSAETALKDFKQMYEEQTA